MNIYQEIALKDFNFWSGAKDRAAKLTDKQFEIIEQDLEAAAPVGGWTDTAINDLFWFEFDYIVQILGYKDEEHFDAGVSDDDMAEAYEWAEYLDTEDMLDAMNKSEEDFTEEGKDEPDEDKVYDAFWKWWDELTGIEQVEVFRKNS